MEKYTDQDLTLIPYNDQLTKLLKRTPLKALIVLIAQWLQIPQLKPNDPSTTIHNYRMRDQMPLKQKDALHRITTLDYPHGLACIQIAQLDLMTIRDRKATRSWKICELARTGTNANGGSIKLDLEATDIRTSLTNHLSPFFSTYVYGFHDKKRRKNTSNSQTMVDTYWFRINLQSRHEEPLWLALAGKPVYLIYYPETEFVILGGGKWPTAQEGHLKLALLNVFDAERMRSRGLEKSMLKDVQEYVRNRKTQAVFSELQNGGGGTLGANPLDIRQKRAKGFDEGDREQVYVKGKEKMRRIKPMDPEEISRRYEAVNQNFGTNELKGLAECQIELQTKFQKSLQPNNDEDEDAMQVDQADNDSDTIINISLTIKGKSVAEAVRHMLLAGTIQTPAPEWILGLGLGESAKIYVTEQGVLEEVVDELYDPEFDYKQQEEDVSNN